MCIVWQHSVDRLRGGTAILAVGMMDHTLHALSKICLDSQKGSAGLAETETNRHGTDWSTTAG